ncbi:hypothetical protein E8E13_010704 [Curvularia kusanoi]|uniref:RING-type domain-containing protein n=1 Tax=Curvularia kusanoi TaxID=90978 RepID=A0A9P4TMP0_CURKU|nr:hypothetical protein E8E13_010704 [Curvularia kusanoi]
MTKTYHWVCKDDIGSFFLRATETESLYPPKCCGQIFLLEVYEPHLEFDVSWAYQVKEQGEYAVLAKYRIYCANPTCSKFLDPATHVEDESRKLTYAVCQDGECAKATCTKCKALMENFRSHACEQNEDLKQFRQTAVEKGYQECPRCASTVELAEACNHITCECGAEFCYVCGDEWSGLHGCPVYGPAYYDEDGYNQDGFHRTTGLNHEGRTRREEAGDEDDDDGDDDDNSDNEEDNHNDGWDGEFDENHPALQHVHPDVRAVFATFDRDERETFLLNLQVSLFEEQGITFGNPEGDNEGNSVDENEDDEDESHVSEHEPELGEAAGENTAQSDENEGPGGHESDDSITFVGLDGEQDAINEASAEGAWPNMGVAFVPLLERGIGSGGDGVSESGESHTASNRDEDRPPTPMDID